MTDAHTVEISLARLADSRRLADLSRTCIEDGLPWRWRPERVRALIRAPEVIVVTARVDRTLAGFAAMQFGESHAHLILLAIDPAFRRQRLADRLMAFLEQSCDAAGIQQIGLEVRADNDVARGFYRELGFVDSRYVPGYYDGRIAAWRMLRRRRPGQPLAMRPGGGDGGHDAAQRRDRAG